MKNRLNANLAESFHNDERSLYHWCPGCNEVHRIPVTGKWAWGFNDNIEAPTLSPSIKHTCKYGDDTPDKVCHYFIKDGFIEFCGDCTHALSNEKIPLQEIPDSWM